MTELAIIILRTRQDIVNALKNKASLWNKGIEVSGLVVSEEGEDIPMSVLGDIMQLPILGVFKKARKSGED